MLAIGEKKRGREIGRKPARSLFMLVECPVCKGNRWVMVLHGKPRSKLCRTCNNRIMLSQWVGEKNPSWNGGKSKASRGYIYNYAPYHPYAHRHRYVLVHRLVMEQELGRYLLPTEVVHHIDGNLENNELSNLYLFNCQGEHCGFHNRERTNWEM